MTTTYRKKLIEVSLPLAAINAESAREKSIRHGHPSTLHLWWARRPLAACRAVLFTSLVDDPDSDPQFRKLDGSVDEDLAGIKRADLFNLIEELVAWENSNNPEVIRSARAEIARCVASRKIELNELDPDLVLSPGNGKSPKVTVRDLVTKGHCRPIPMGLDKKAGRVRFSFDVSRLPPAEVVNAFLADHAPPVLDPFAGGGSIPLEAQRLGLRAFASDLNPVPVLINKALIEIPPKFAGRPPINPESRSGGSRKGKKQLIEHDWPGATGLAEDVRYYGKWMRDEAEKRIGHLYPKVEVTEEMAKDRPDLKDYVGQKLTVIAWLWSRTVASPNPACDGAHVPINSTFMLSSRPEKKAWVELIRDEKSRDGWHFQAKAGELSKEAEAKAKFGARAGKAKDFLCSLSGTPITRSYIQAEGKADRLGSRLMAVVADGGRGRAYLSPDDELELVASSANGWPIVDEARSTFLSGTTPTRAMITGGVCSAYGLRTWGHLFTPRQLVALSTFSDLVQETRTKVLADTSSNWPRDSGSTGGPDAYADAIATYLAFALSSLTNRSSALCSWDSSRDNVRSVFARQALPMTWDFAEANPVGEASGSWPICTEAVTKCLLHWQFGHQGKSHQLDATAAIENLDQALLSTDPPYYDNISYAELADFFYVWLRRSLKGIYQSLFATTLTPKSQELIASPYRHEGSRQKSQEFFEAGLGKAFERMREVQPADYPLTVYYAFKQSETEDDSDVDSLEEATTASTGWETMLAGLIRSGFGVTGTWPMRTELGNRMVGMGSNALASSIVLVCRRRSAKAPLATRKEFITALRRELPDALRNLQHGNIAPVDLAQSAIGPGMAVFTRYAKVLESDGSSMSVRAALGLINQTLDEVLAEQEGEFDSDTRWALSWFEQFGTDEGPFGDAETLSKAKNTAINGLVEAGIIVAKSGKVRLIRRDELPANWNPATDKRLTVWEVTQHLIHRLDEQGETGAAGLVGQLGGIGEIARDLAYRLYSTCERKKWAQEALAYNSLVVAWPELTKLARASGTRQEVTQPELF